MGKIFTEVSRIVSEDISSRVTQFDVVFEAITNSIQANATEIKCFLKSQDNPFIEEEEWSAIKVDEIRIVDNGEGITDENYESFSKYRTDYKKELGCKGVGRFVFLKVYNKATYESCLKDEQEKRFIDFHINFDTDSDFKKEECVVTQNETTVKFQYLRENYLNWDKKLDRRIDLDIFAIRDKTLLNLIPTLYFYKQKGVDIKVSFIDENSNTSVHIDPSDIPDFSKEEFSIFDTQGEKHLFILNYTLKNFKKSLKACYCANNRTVCDFEDKDLKISLPNGHGGYMLLESKYFDGKVNNERNGFDIFPVKTDVFSTISWDTINTQLKRVIGSIIKVEIPQAISINKEKLLIIQEERPYLINYIDEDDIEIAGVLDKKQIIEKAKKKFDASKEQVLNNANKANFSDEELTQAILLAQNELVSYINDRVIIIEKLKQLIANGERVESIIHNMIMEKYTTSFQAKDEYISVDKNNLWLLDDRFTTYSYAASDNRIKDILTALNIPDDDSKISNNKPDFSLFFSHDPNNQTGLRSVLVELKPFDYASQSHRKKHQGLLQLREYLKAFKAKEKIQEVYGYLITDVDKEFSEALKEDDFVAMYSSENPIYHKYYDKLDISIFVVSVKTLVYDAEARNKMFLEIIKKNSKISEILRN